MMVSTARRLLAGFIRLDGSHRRLLTQAAARHLAIACLIRTPARRMLSRWWSGAVEQRMAATADAEAEARVVWAVKTATSLIPIGRTCLTEALTVHWLLSVAGCASVVRIGVARSVDGGAPLLAHAWVECGGRAVIGGETTTAYHPLVHAREQA